MGQQTFAEIEDLEKVLDLIKAAMILDAPLQLITVPDGAFGVRGSSTSVRVWWGRDADQELHREFLPDQS